MFTQTTIILGTMVGVFVLALWLLKTPPELSMILAAVGGALVGRFGIPVTHIVEGAFTYLDIVFTITAATIFMNVLKESGMLYAIVRSMVARFYRRRAVLLVLLMLVLLLPGALTGSGTVSILVSGGVVAMVLGFLGVPPVNVAAIVFMGAALSVVAPPVNIYAMIISGGVNMPYIGFFAPLAIPILVLAVFSVMYLGWRGKPLDLDKALEQLPKVPERLGGFKVFVPLIVLVGLMVASRVFPHSMPILGLPLEFIMSAAVALVIIAAAGQKLDIVGLSRRTVKQLFPLIATLTGVGILVQILTLTGVRGLFVISIVSLPILLVYLGLLVGVPLGEAVLLYGVAAVIGVPAVLLLSHMGKDAIVVTTGITLLAPLGDALPPTAILGRITNETVGYRGSYGEFLKKCAVPAAAVAAVGIAMVIFANSFRFLLL